MSFAALDLTNKGVRKAPLPPPVSNSNATATTTAADDMCPPIPGNHNRNSLTPTIQTITSDISQYQRNLSLLQQLQQKITGEMASSPRSMTFGGGVEESAIQFDAQLSVVTELSSRISSKISRVQQSMQNMDRGEAAKYRHTVGKLTKDFGGLKRNESRVKASVERWREAEKMKKKQQGSTNRDINSSNGGDALFHEEMSNKLQQVQINPSDMNEEILRERNTEIRAINEQMANVNEIFKDLAHIVNNQQEDVDNIEEMMEKTHEHAKAGLEQVEKANEYQKGCLVQ